MALAQRISSISPDPMSNPNHPEAEASELSTACWKSLLFCPSACGALIDFVDTNALQVVGLVLFPLLGAISFLISAGKSLSRDFRAAHTDWFGQLAGGATGAAAEETGPMPPPPPSAPDWGAIASEAAFSCAASHPLVFLALDFAVGITAGLLILFWKDLQDWLQRRFGLHARQQYRPLPAAGSAEPDTKTSPPLFRRVSSVETSRVELQRVINQIEEIEIRMRVSRGARGEEHESKHHPQGNDEETVELAALIARREELELELTPSGGGPLLSSPSDDGDGPRDDHGVPVGNGGTSCLDRFARSNFAAVLRSSTNGLVTIAVYFADVVSDVQVALLLMRAGAIGWSDAAFVLLLGQFVAVYLRVLPYFGATFGASSIRYRVFLLLGFPFGIVLLDVLMFLEPFGLLAVLPLPMWLKQFIPAYKATRIIAEVTLESLPQCLLQSYIFVVVQRSVAAGTAGPAARAIHPFASLLPKSICISTVAMVKIWLELVQTSRQAGMSVRARFVQLWHVGAGLPLDALKKGAIAEWDCPRALDSSEMRPLLIALMSNSSLRRLNLAQSGLGWEVGGTGVTLLDAMAKSRACLTRLQSLTLSESGFELPVEQLRLGGEVAMAALHKCRFFGADGPRRLEILAMGDMLRRNRRPDLVTAREEEQSEVAVAMVEAARRQREGPSTAAGAASEREKGRVSPRVALSREEWELETKRMIVSGGLRRAQLQSLLRLDVLRGVGFSAGELHAAGFSLEEIKGEGHFTASELLSSNGLQPLCTVQTLQTLGYTVRELRDAKVPASALMEMGWPAEEMRKGGFSPAELRMGGYALEALKRAGYPLALLTKAGYSLAELRAVGTSPAELRSAGVKADAIRAAGFAVSEMVGAFAAKELINVGFTPKELRAGGMEAKHLRGAGGTWQAGVTTKVLAAAGYSIAELKAAGVKSKELEKAGFKLHELCTRGHSKAEDAGFSLAELRHDGYEWHELVIECKANYEELLAAGFDAGRKGDHTSSSMHADHQLFRNLKQIVPVKAEG